MTARARSFRHAARGVLALVREQHNARIHLAATLAVVAAATFFGVSALAWCVLLLAIGLVWGAEAMNTALEHLADAVMPEQDPLIGKAKDAAAGAVLLCAIVAASVALLVFVPPVVSLLARWLE